MIKPLVSAFFSILTIAQLTACSDSNTTLILDQNADQHGHTAPSTATIKANKAVIEQLPFSNQQDFKDAKRGLIASLDSLVINNAEGEPVWDMDAYTFMQYSGVNGNAPASINPSLWRQANLNNIHGLFKVSDGIYQLRGFDLANMTLIEGDSGWIVVDPLTAKETSQFAFDFAQKHLGSKPISAILFTHSHIDHFGGALGLVTAEQVKQQGIRVIAPEGFMEEATSENIIAGTAMSRRSMYMYGKYLPRTERGHIGSGLGKGPAFGRFGILEPTELVNHQTPVLKVDGVNIEFQFTPGSEAPAEFTFYLPDHKAFCGAEVVSRNMHNLYTLRGAKVRDALKWSGYIEQARNRFAGADIYFGSHHWPMWGQDKIQNFLKLQRDGYKYIHDQSVRLLNGGATPNELAEEITLPEKLRTSFPNRGYYGTLKHNAKAVYQNYLGWYDANPANLDPLPPQNSAQRYIKLMGGIEQVVAQAQIAFDQAEEDAGAYRWVAELLNKAVFSDPDHKEAKALLAKTYDQLGYQAESAPWRDVYLSAAYELRHGGPDQGIDIALMREVLLETPVERFFDTLSIRLNGPKAEGKDYAIKINFTDKNLSYVLNLENSVLYHQSSESWQNKTAGPINATLNVKHKLFIDMLIGKAGLKKTLFSDDLTIDGSKLDLLGFLSLFDRPMGNFNIVVP
ncbi:MAG: alkyl sulfatase BDS1-like metallo-beta-lactamase superfamily hydrolase [Pseudohongiellaceae bacterium]|jgi:alkyl sulfatase BDS1-like metallo-beta-lactamase superfamily hydrolase